MRLIVRRPISIAAVLISAMEVRKRIGANVKRLRVSKGLSQERFGFESGIDRTYVSGIERGVRNPTATIIEKLAEALGVPSYRLLQEPDEVADS